jgi:cell division protein FtsB
VFDDEVVAERRGLIAGIGRWSRAAMLPLLFLACCGYFAWHAVHGERGLVAMEQRDKDITEARAEQERVMAELGAMERRVNGLRGERLDRDQLEERARQLLNMVGKHEIVVPYGPERRLF